MIFPVRIMTGGILCLLCLVPDSNGQTSDPSDPVTEENHTLGQLSRRFPPTMGRSFDHWMSSIPNSQLRDGDYENLGEYLATFKEEAKEVYSSYDYLLYAAGLIAQVDGKGDKALEFYDEYLWRRAGDNAFEPLVHPPPLESLHRGLARLQEIVWNKWGDDRWAFHICEVNQPCLEYHNVLANRIRINGDVSLSSSTALGPATNHRVVEDYKKFWKNLRLEDSQEPSVADLKESISRWPVPMGLLEHVEDLPSRIWSLTALGIALSVGGVILLWLPGPKSTQYSRVDLPEYELHKRDVFGKLVVDRWRGSRWRLLVGTLWIWGLAPCLLAGSEGSLLRNSFVVDRSFFDYWSFPAANLVLIPLCFIIGTSFYMQAPAMVSLVTHSITATNTEPRVSWETKWARWRRVMIHPVTVSLIFVTTVLVVRSQKLQWMDDPGTAFVDLAYPGNIYPYGLSLTGWYLTFASGALYFILITLIWRFAFVLIFVGVVFAQSRAGFGTTTQDWPPGSTLWLEFSRKRDRQVLSADDANGGDRLVEPRREIEIL